MSEKLAALLNEIVQQSVSLRQMSLPVNQNVRLNSSALELLILAAREPNLTGRQAAARLGLTPGAISQNAARLSSLGLLESERHGHFFYLRPSAAGKKLLEKTGSIRQDLAKGLQVSGEEEAVIEAYFKQVLSLLQGTRSRLESLDLSETDAPDF